MHRAALPTQPLITTGDRLLVVERALVPAEVASVQGDSCLLENSLMVERDCKPATCP